MQFSDLEYAPPVLTPELSDIKARATRVAKTLGVSGPLVYLGAGASAVVFAVDDLALKVARLGVPGAHYRAEIVRQKRVDFLSEAEYMMDAEDRGLPVVRVAPHARPAFLVESIVIVKELVDGTPGNPGSRGLGDLWKRINQEMADRWGPVEFKESNFIVPFPDRRGERGTAILVDCGGAVRRGKNLLEHSIAAARGVIDDPDAEPRGPTREESYLRWSIRMDTEDGRIPERAAAQAIAELDARYGAPVKLNPDQTRTSPRKPYVPCAPGVHARALEDDETWATWPLVSIDKQMGLETRRCPACSSTQSRLLEETPLENPSSIKLTKGEKVWAEWAIDPMEEFWQGQIDDGDDEVTEIPPLPTIEGNVLHLPDHDDVIDDFLYRLEDQASDMAEDESAWRQGKSGRAPVEAIAGALKRSPLSLAKKIRQATGRAD